jgi:hypothetical protein
MNNYTSIIPNVKEWRTTVPPTCHCEGCRARYLSFRYIGVTTATDMIANRCGITSQTFEQCALSEGHQGICNFTIPYLPAPISTTVLIFWNGKRLGKGRFVDLWHAEKWSKFCIPVTSEHKEER